MNREILAACVAAVLIALLYCWQWRYEFDYDPGLKMTWVGDHWTGCGSWLDPGGGWTWVCARGKESHQ